MDQVAPGQFVGDEEVLIVPTAETVKQSFFLELSLGKTDRRRILSYESICYLDIILYGLYY